MFTNWLYTVFVTDRSKMRFQQYQANCFHNAASSVADGVIISRSKNRCLARQILKKKAE